MNDILPCMLEKESYDDELNRLNDNFDRIPTAFTGDRDLPKPRKKVIQVKPTMINFYARFEELFKAGLFIDIIEPGLPEQGKK